MAHTVKVLDFKPEYLNLPAIQSFDCGTEPWEREVAEWIRGGPGGVLDDMQRGCEVWLYATDEDGLVGFGSLSASRWQWPLPDSPRVPINLIPMVGIQRRFWGKPDGPPDERFSAQILDHLIFQALRHTERQSLLGLFVDPRNVRAIRVYERAGFVRFSKTYRDHNTGIVYESMLLNLPTPLPNTANEGASPSVQRAQQVASLQRGEQAGGHHPWVQLHDKAAGLYAGIGLGERSRAGCPHSMIE